MEGSSNCPNEEGDARRVEDAYALSPKSRAWYLYARKWTTHSNLTEAQDNFLQVTGSMVVTDRAE